MKTTFRHRVFEHHLKEDGKINVKVRIYHNGKERYIATNINASKSEITKQYTLKDGSVSYRGVQKLILKYQDRLESIQRPESIDIDTLILLLKSEFKTKTEDFFSYAAKMIERMRSKGKNPTANNYQIMLNSLHRFNPGSLSFEDITVAFLKKYENHLRTSTFTIGKSKTLHRTGERGLSLYMGLIRSVINDAIREYNSDEQVINSPFDHGRYRIPKEAAPEQRSLPVEIIREIRGLELKGGRAIMARDVFMLSFYLMGMNAADIYACTEYRNGRIDYNRQKTASRRQDKAFFSVLVNKDAEIIIDQYRGSERVFRFSQQYSSLNNFNRALREGLKQIGEILNVHLEFYAARHSFASIARNDCGVDKYTVHEALNHVDAATKITDTYIRKNWGILDEMNRKVQDYVRGV